jgi:hypothetical protein
VSRVSTAIPRELLERVLQPYRSNCHYVLEAMLTHPEERRAPQPDAPETWIVVDGRCAIPGSCYIDDTGHFNAVEMNITYNQLLYLGLAGVAAHGLIAELGWDLPAFLRHQLPDVLIVDYHARFPRPLHPRAFTGRFEIREVVPKAHKHMVLLRTACTMRSEPDGHAFADVMIALVRV